MTAIRLRALPDLPEVKAGDDLAALIRERLRDVGAADGACKDTDILCIAHKVVSKAEGRVVALADVLPSERALELAATVGKDPRLVEVILSQSTTILRAARGVLICRTHAGFVCANAGVDVSNVGQGSGEDGGTRGGNGGTDGEGGGTRGEGGGTQRVIVHPLDADASARAIRARLHALTGARPAIVITDTFGRAWRNGQCDIAIGCAGLTALEDWRGRTDSFGRDLHVTRPAIADCLAAASDLVRTKDSREPVIVVEGLDRFVTDEDGPGAAASLVRPIEEDLFL